jgi:hypothetical protein
MSAPMDEPAVFCCFLCRETNGELVRVTQLRTTLTTRPLLSVFSSLLADQCPPLAETPVICLKCSGLLDQVDSLDLQLKLKSDEVRTLYYNSWGKTEDSTGVQRKVAAARRKPVKRTTLQYPCLQNDRGETVNKDTIPVEDFVHNIDTTSTLFDELRPPNKMCRSRGQRTRKSMQSLVGVREHDGKTHDLLPVLDSEETARTEGAESQSNGLDSSSLDAGGGEWAVQLATVEAGEECPRCVSHIAGGESSLGKSPSSFDVI